ncbi:(2Fe-2S)-binding protein [Ancylobacter dichloromethanicus]|uniref:Bacterioferritin-associated ferredoxin n=1 Tax=Ancylobacter dichloromethanicus TaxID=518825 RepID=A0A9W6JEC7_9HYPH|nr:(2Fe-2S)-binding protein [Ancylobacter dichloromethanicus]MBS7552439.1 (2Fe-2S)-binding protein [Ancylobacter dichloromethanicus]GLK74179.1 hypothetical protein GCM10017643_42970 [Ancylobacter dichloromethanicus]
MIVCSCNVLSDRQIRSAVTETQASVRTVGQVYRCLGCSAQCGRCARTIRKLLDDVNAGGCGTCPLECPVAAQVPGQAGHGEAAPSGLAQREQGPRRHGRRDHAHPHSSLAAALALAAE